MEDVYYAPEDYTQDNLFAKVDNKKDGRTSEDLLFQSLLELGATLDCKIETETINGKTIYKVDGNYIAACFDKGIDDDTVKAMARTKPVYAIVRDGGFASDSALVNIEQIFKTISPDTTTRIL